jgi:hypothetical protein
MSDSTVLLRSRPTEYISTMGPDLLIDSLFRTGAAAAGGGGRIELLR